MYTRATLSGLLATSLVATSEATSFRLPLTRRANAKSDDQSLTSIYGNTDWTTSVQFGNQNFTLQVDTGSSDIWVLSTEMSKDKQNEHPKNHFFDPSKSKSFKFVDGAKFNITYDTGEIFGAGKVGTDDISIGSDTVNMPFGVATDLSPGTGMVDTMYDGILGLAFGAGNTQSPKKGPTWMEAIMSQLDKPVFTINLPLGGAPQMMEFGHIDHTLYNGTLLSAAILNGTKDSPNGWTASVGFSLGGKNISKVMNQLLMDTGGMESSIPDKDAVNTYWGTVKGAQDSSAAKDGSAWLFPCQGPELPDLTFDFMSSDGRTVSATIPGRFFNSTTASSDPTVCVGAFQATTGQGTIGYPFFHSFFSVFDQSVPSLAFAPYPNQELLSSKDQSASSSSSSSGTASSAASSSTGTASGTATGTSATGTATGASASASVTGSAASRQSSKPTASGSVAASGSALAASASAAAASGGSAAANAAKPSATDSAPGANSSVNPGKSSASATVPSLVLVMAAVIGGLMAF